MNITKEQEEAINEITDNKLESDFGKRLTI